MKKLCVVLTVLAAAVCPAVENPHRAVGDFIRGLAEKEPEKRASLLLSVAGRHGYPADLALIYLVRGPMPDSLSTRLTTLAEKRRGELIPALLLLRNPVRDSESGWRLAYAAWQSAANRGLSDFERPLFREFSGRILILGAEIGEYRPLRSVVEALVARHPDDWERLIPPPELLDFYRACAFVDEGHELPSPKWIDSELPARRAYAGLRRKCAKYIPKSPDEAERLIRHYMSSGESRAAMETAMRYFVGNKSEAGFNLLLGTGIETGRTDLINELRPHLKPDKVPAILFDTLLRGGDAAGAEKLLPQIVDPEESAAAKCLLLESKGDFRALGELAMKPDAAIPGERRMFALLLAAEQLKDRKYLAAAERLFGDAAKRDPAVANALGYVTLVLGGDAAVSEWRIRFAVTVRPCEGAYLDSLAWAHYLRGDFSGAWKQMAAALKYMPPVPESCEILEHAGEIQLALGDRKRADEFFRKALSLARSGSSSFPRGALFRAAEQRISAKIVDRATGVKKK